jgi:hypothetical protein
MLARLPSKGRARTILPGVRTPSIWRNALIIGGAGRWPRGGFGEKGSQTVARNDGRPEGSAKLGEEFSPCGVVLGIHAYPGIRAGSRGWTRGATFWRPDGFRVQRRSWKIAGRGSGAGCGCELINADGLDVLGQELLRAGEVGILHHGTGRNDDRVVGNSIATQQPATPRRSRTRLRRDLPWIRTWTSRTRAVALHSKAWR